MKSLIFAFLVSLSVQAFAATTSLVIKTDDGVAEISISGGSVNADEMDAAWGNGGQSSVFEGNLCYKGYRQSAIAILNYMADHDFMGDEMIIQDVQAASGGKISYVIYDGPNDEVANEVTVGLCQ
jgi:hypothetical protein